MVKEAFKVLINVARSFEEQGLPFEAIKCLQAISQSVRSEVPHFQAEILLKLAKLLICHTYNLRDAIQHLDRALLVVKKLKTHALLKCDILGELVKCQSGVGNNKAALSSCKAGIAICQQPSQHAEKGVLQQWEMYFQSMLIPISQYDQDSTSTLEAIESAIARAKSFQDKEAIAFLRIALVQHCLQENLSENWNEALREAQMALKNFEDQDNVSILCAKLNLELLQVVWQLRLGNIAQLQTPGSNSKDPAIVTRVQVLYEAIMNDTGEHKVYGGMPKEYLLAHACIVLSCIWRPVGKIRKAQQCLEIASEHLQTGLLQYYGICQDDNKEGKYSQESKMLVQLQAVLLEEQALIALTSTDLTQAKDIMIKLFALFSDNASLQKSEYASIHMLAGYYCRAISENGEARRHFIEAAQASEKPQDIQIAVAEICMILLDPSEGEPCSEADILEVMDLLKKHKLWFHSELNVDEARQSVLGMYLTAKALLAKGDLTSGRPILLKAMKKGHALLQHHQLVSKVMSFLAPLYVDSDIATSQTMIETGFKLAHGQADLVGQVMSLRTKVALSQKQSTNAEAEEQKAYLQKRVESLEFAVQTALQDQSNSAAIVSWGLRQAAS